jgi:AcrR family transcriptional regulator
MPSTVRVRKSRRSYDASRRQERAREQQEAALAHAHRLFLERGYAATTVEAIARAAGVSAATVYKSYGGKAGLVRRLCERALAGEGPVPAETRSNALRSDDDVHSVVTAWGALAAEVSPRISPLALVLRSAAETDPEAGSLHAEISQARLRRMTDNARFLAAHGHLRAGVSARTARDVLWWCTSPEFYDLMVVQRGWSPKRFGQLVSETISGTLL